MTDDGSIRDDGIVYAAEKFSIARRILMLPHPHGVAASIAECFRECLAGLEGIELRYLDQRAIPWVATINRLVDTEGLTDDTGVGTFEVRARMLSQDDQLELSQAVDELADWFNTEAGKYLD